MATLDEALRQPAGGGVLRLLGNGHNADALAPRHRLAGDGVLPLRVNLENFQTSISFKGVLGSAGSPRIFLSSGRLAIRPLSAQSLYSSATM